jgi:phospholipid/cholesterol/gamma-HCH transport system substrate-binding protein
MNERRMQFRVGLVVFVTMIVGGLLASLNGPFSVGWLPWGHSNYEVGIEVPQAPGVDTNTPVRKNGILIGRIKAIEDKDAGVLLKAEIYGRPLYSNYEPHVRTTVLGDATIDFLSRRPIGGEQPVADGTIFKGQVDPNPFDSLGQLGDLKEEFGNASRSLAGAGDEVEKLAKRVNQALGDETGETQGRVTRLIDTTERAMNQFAATMTSFNEILGDGPIPGAQPGVSQPPPTTQPPFNTTQPPLNNQPPLNSQPQPNVQPPGAPPSTNGQQMRQKLRQGLDELPDAIHEFRIAMRESRGVLQSAERNFKNLEAFTEPLGQKGPEFADAILDAIAGLDQLVKDLGDVAAALNNRSGTVGKLIHDPQVYENLNRLMFNVNEVLCDVRQFIFNLKPVVHDARIFMDKVATEPGRIINGAISPSVVK